MCGVVDSLAAALTSTRTAAAPQRLLNAPAAKRSPHSNLEAMASFTSSTRSLSCSALALVLLLVTASCETDPLDCVSDDDNLPFSPATGTIKCSAADRAALLEFKSSISKDPNKALTSWISTGSSGAYNCCAWNGVTCDGATGRVVRLKLPQAGLKGKLAPGLGALSHLLVLSLYENSFSGGIPSSFGNLTRLQKICLSSTGLSGPIPESFGRLASLQMLDLSSNKLSGPLPQSIGNMSSLQEIHVGSNDISGPIPPSFGLLSNLFNADMAVNKFSGLVPDSFNHNLTFLFYLFLNNNQITGLPKNLSNLKSLELLDLDNNNLSVDMIAGLVTAPMLTEIHLSSCHLSGPFPTWIGSLPRPDSLHLSDEVTNGYIDLSNNALTGPIPADIGSLPDYWEIISLSNNRLSGRIPSTLGNLTALQNLRLEHNELSGPIPSSFSRLQSLTLGFNVSFNRLTGEIPQVSPFTTFSVSAYEGNPGLCGTPLPACERP